MGGVAEGYVWNLAEGLPSNIQDGTTKYVTGPGGLPLEQVASGGTVLYYYQDQLGSTRELMDASGTTAATYTYDAYGNMKSSTGSVSNPFQYAGQYTDSESGLQYLRSRYYDPNTQQFLTVDPLVGATGQPYAYGAGSPVNSVDPTGQWTILDDLSAITLAAAGGAGYSVVTQLVTTGSVDWGQVGIDAVAGATGAEVALYAGPVAGAWPPGL